MKIFVFSQFYNNNFVNLNTYIFGWSEVNSEVKRTGEPENLDP